MSFFSRLTPSKRRDFSRCQANSARRLRRRATSKRRRDASVFLAGALLLTVAPAAVSADDAVVKTDAPGLYCSRPARTALFCDLAGIPAVPANWANRANWASSLCVASLDATSQFPFGDNSHFLPPFFSPSNVWSTFDVPLVSAPQTAQSLQTAQTLPILPASQTVPSPETASIVRGGYISSLPIAPFRGRIFAYADGSWGKQAEQNASPFAAGFNVASFGGGVGQDWRLSKNAIWGLGFQGREIQLDPASSIYESEIDSLAGFLRLSFFGPLWRLDLSLGAAKNWTKQLFPAHNDVKYSSTQWNYEAEFGVRFDKGYTRVEPLVNLRALTLHEPALAERPLVSFGRAHDYSDASYRLKLGSRFSWEYATHLATLKPYLTATWAHEFGDRALYTSGENTPFPIVYRYARHKMARDRLDLGGGVDAALRDSLDLYFRYDVEFAKEYANYLFYAGFHKKF